MTHQHLSFQSLHGFQSNTDNDDDGGTADCQALDAGNQNASHDGQQSDDAKVNSTKDNNLVDNLLDELSGGSAGTEAGDETTFFFRLLAISVGSYWMVA